MCFFDQARSSDPILGIACSTADLLTSGIRSRGDRKSSPHDIQPLWTVNERLADTKRGLCVQFTRVAQL